MRNILLVVLISLLIAEQGLAQGRRSSRDSIGVIPWRNAIKQAPVLTGRSEPRNIVPHEQPLCFPTEFDLKINIPGKIVEQAMFINANTGVIGYLPPHSDGLVNFLFPELADFSFWVMGLKGNMYHYSTRKGKNNIIEKWVSTGNTETHQYQMTGSHFTGEADLQRKNVTAPYCNGSLTAMAYRFSNAPNMTWYLYGDRFPEKLHPRKFLGNFGVGYLQTDEGLYIITEFRTSSYTCRVTDIQVTNTCLHTTEFKLMENEFIQKQTEAVQKQKQKLERDAAGVSGNCSNEQSALIGFKQELARKREEALRQAKTGNTYQDVNVQRSLQAMMDPLTTVQEGILSTKLSICRAMHSNSSKREEKLNCLTNQLSELTQLEVQMKALDARYVNEPGKAYAEKSKLYLQKKPMKCG
ncbi:hypothetical protein [Pseudobacter ginsenosidimutans]|uniref:Uncharacterized protein n=1 Tax=Pseudobacter ginsenosidimutans TaxID=661488 RepID=A0A4Q7MFJ3_9BACT|nr:hypothetical protein [Pseudobacter ginsenosidimutans]QEC45235.1 hypothetical protein FSB84_27400 [Pseudobacter ginsenosidimutans]RZS65502.1 hypothetical protein EV199_5676 [Pseudobacter ginsenosidimutans]